MLAIDDSHRATSASTTKVGSLLTAARRGDPAAMGELFVTVKPRVRAQVRRSIQDDVEIDDVVQRVFLAILRGLPEYRGEPAVETWIARKTASAVRRVFRRQNTRRSLKHELQLALQLRAAGAPEARLDARGRLHRLLGHLPEDLRRLVVLYHHEGWTHQEISADVGISLSTVSKQLALARRMLRDLAERT